MRFLIVVLLTAPMLISAGTIRASEIEAAFSENCALLLRGPIVIGDRDKLQAALASSGVPADRLAAEMRGDPGAMLCLDSPGGIYMEAIEIARLVAEKGLATVIDDGMDCLSACGLVFMAGRTHGLEADYINRRLHVRGRLGFSAPYIEVPVATKPDEVAQAYLAALASLLEVANSHGTFNPTPRIRASLIEQMLRQPADEMYFVDTVNKVGRWDIELLGYRLPAVNDAAIAHACNNLISWKRDEFSQSKYAQADTVRPSRASSSWDGRPALITRVDKSGLLALWCDVETPLRGEAAENISVCVVDQFSDIRHGYRCDGDDARGASIPAFYMFNPDLLLSEIPG